MARKQDKNVIRSMMENLEERQMFSTYGTVNISLTSITPSVVVDYTRLGVDQSWGAGEFEWTRSASNPGTYSNKADATGIDTFCIEPDQDVTTPVVTYTVTDLSSTNCHHSSGPLTDVQAALIENLWAKYHTDALTSGVKAAAFQMAIWKIVCDQNLNLSTGTLTIDTTTATDVAVKAQAQTWLNSLTLCGPRADLLALTSPTDQDQVFEVNCTPPTHCCTGAFNCTVPTWHCILSDNSDCLTKHDSTGGCL